MSQLALIIPLEIDFLSSINEMLHLYEAENFDYVSLETSFFFDLILGCNQPHGSYCAILHEKVVMHDRVVSSKTSDK